MSRIKGKSYPRRKACGLRKRAWWSIRKDRVVTLEELLMTHAESHHRCAAGNLGKFLRELTRAGVLTRERVQDGKLTSNGVYRYTLIRDLGPQAPLCRADGSVFDPNRGQDVLPVGCNSGPPRIAPSPCGGLREDANPPYQEEFPRHDGEGP